jgi:hypothetical protein
VIAWTVSGFLVAWNCWKLPLIAYLAIAGPPAGEPWPENLGAAAAQCLLGVLAGSALLATLLHARRAHQATIDATPAESGGSARTDHSNSVRMNTSR